MVVPANILQQLRYQARVLVKTLGLQGQENPIRICLGCYENRYLNLLVIYQFQAWQKAVSLHSALVSQLQPLEWSPQVLPRWLPAAAGPQPTSSTATEDSCVNPGFFLPCLLPGVWAPQSHTCSLQRRQNDRGKNQTTARAMRQAETQSCQAEPGPGFWSQELSAGIWGQSPGDPEGEKAKLEVEDPQAPVPNTGPEQKPSPFVGQECDLDCPSQYTGTKERRSARAGVGGTGVDTLESPTGVWAAVLKGLRTKTPELRKARAVKRADRRQVEAFR